MWDYRIVFKNASKSDLHIKNVNSMEKFLDVFLKFTCIGEVNYVTYVSISEIEAIISKQIY